MGRKAKKLQELEEMFSNNEVDFKVIEDTSVLKELRVVMDGISETRHESYIRHKLGDVIMITLLAVMSNANEWIEIEAFGRGHEKWLREFLELENGIPSDDTIRIVIASLNSNYIYSIVIDFLMKKIDAILAITEQESQKSKEIISCDGKTSISSKRGTTTKPAEKALHTLNAYSSDYGFCIAQEFVDEKSNEITSMPELLKRLDLNNAIVTWDALNTQKDIVEAVMKGKGDYVGALKGNQHNFYRDVVDYFTTEVIEEIKKDCSKYKKATEKEHSAVITREYFITDDIHWLYNKEKWKGLQAIGMERKTIKKDNPELPCLIEIRYFICSFTDIHDFSRAVRDH